MSLNRNDLVTLSITGMNAQGNGVGHIAAGEGAGMAVFVPFAAVGDELECRIVKVEKRFAYGRMERLLTRSADRLSDSGCAVYGRCGGCTYRHIRYEAELRDKQQRVADAIKRVGGFDLPVQPIVGCDMPDGYRNKAQYPVAAGEKAPLIGFYAPRSHRVIEQRHCPLQPVLFGTVLDVVADWMSAYAVPAYDEQTRTGLVRHIYLRQARATGELMVCLVCTSGRLPHTAELVEAVQKAAPSLQSLCVNINREDTNVVLGRDGFTLYGGDAITDELCGLRFRLSPKSFYQVNHDQAERLYKLAAEAAALTSEDTLLDLYCGAGTIGLTMAAQAAQVIGVELVPQAVEDARRNAAANGIENARFLCADAMEATARLQKEGVHPRVVVLDPPRKGCDDSLPQVMAELAPERVVYVSCDPATLARDMRRLAEQGYQPQRITPVDMFPRTAHVETVVLMSR